MGACLLSARSIIQPSGSGTGLRAGSKKARKFFSSQALDVEGYLMNKATDPNLAENLVPLANPLE
jgi:hypothetical protein